MPKLEYEKVEKIISLLKLNSRMTLTEIGKKLNIPVSSVYDLFKRRIEKDYKFTIIKKDGGVL